MDKKKLIYTAVSAAVVAFVIALVFNVSKCDKSVDNTENVKTVEKAENNETAPKTEPEQKTENEAETKSEKEAENEDVKMPTFMYVVSNQDKDYEAYMKAVDELKAEYDGKVKFDINDINENETMKVLIGEKTKTPCLIMINKDGASVDVKDGCTDKAVMSELIESTLK